ncbi:MAG: ribulose-phosphate 3-epimerase [Actinobacteria bacterium]|nr:ribulose-phosphate 3-epimerase [Actinomycetota bacterium]
MSQAELLRDRRVAPSILAADFARIGSAVEEVMDAGARVIHVDVMDGHFVPPISIGPQIVEGLKGQVDAAGGWLDVHLMIDRPERHVTEFAGAGADSISVHFEATPHVHLAVHKVREDGCRAGVAITPSTPASALAAIAPDIDIALCMTVNPGWGGQPFLPETLPKVTELRGILDDDVAIEVDGGIETHTAGPCADAGARLFVAGSSVFGQPDPAEAYRQLAEAAGAV